MKTNYYYIVSGLLLLNLLFGMAFCLKAQESNNYEIVDNQINKIALKQVVTTIHKRPDDRDSSKAIAFDLLKSGRIFFTADNLEQNITYNEKDSSFNIPSALKNLRLLADTNLISTVEHKIESDGVTITIDFYSELNDDAEQEFKTDAPVYANINKKPSIEPKAVIVSKSEGLYFYFDLVFEKKAKNETVHFFTDYLETPPETQIGFKWSDAHEDTRFHYKPTAKFARLWEPIKEKDFVFEKDESGRMRVVSIQRKLNQLECELILDGELNSTVRLDTRLYYTNGIETKVVSDEVSLSRKGVWREGENQAKFKISYYLPDSMIVSEDAKLVVASQKEFFFEGYATDNEKFASEAEVALPASEFRLTLRQVPAFQFIYLDLTGFVNLEAVKEILQDKIGYSEADYCLFISNGSNPVVYNTGDDIDEIVKLVSHLRPVNPIIGNEVPKVKPFIDQFLSEKDRIDFNFMVNEVFLNHSTVSFVDQIINEKEKNKLETNFYFFSTAESFSPFKHDFQKEKSRDEQAGKFTNYIQIK
jgi:hypothetical protein